MTTKPRDWIVTWRVPSNQTWRDIYATKCLRCGTVRRFGYDSVDLAQLLAAIRSFEERHAKCAKREEKAST